MVKTTTGKNKSSNGALNNYYNLSNHSSAKRKFAEIKAITIVVLLLVIFVGIPLMISYAKYKSEANMISLDNIEISIAKTPKDYGYDYDEGDYRIVVSGDEIAFYMRQATVAAEDQNFYDCNRTKISQKLLYFSNLSSNDVGELEKMYTRDEILTLYLNEAPYVKEIKGINTAAHTYFNKSAKDLNLAEAAFLAAIPSGSKLLDPADNNDHDTLLEQQRKILDTMVDMGYITSDEAEMAKVVDIFDYINKPKVQLTE